MSTNPSRYSLNSLVDLIISSIMSFSRNQLDKHLRIDSDKSEAKEDVEDVVTKVKAGGTAVVKKVLDTDKDLETEYVKAKRAENEKVQRSAREITSANIPEYKMILVPHDGSEASDQALAHAIYLSKVSKAEIFILNAVEDLHEIAPTTISASPKPTEKGTLLTDEYEATKNEANFASTDNTISEVSGTAKTQTTVSDKELDVTIKGHVIDMIEERIALCKEAGVESHVSYKIQTGNVVDSIVSVSKDIKADIIIMVSEKLGSPIIGIMSHTRKLIDAVEIPVLVLSR
jgi:nucleotide-binding universal stress UspA family protein